MLFSTHDLFIEVNLDYYPLFKNFSPKSILLESFDIYDISI